MTTKIRDREWLTEYQYSPRTRIDGDLDRTKKRRVRRQKRTRFVVRVDPIKFALADGLRWLANVIDGRLG